MAETITLTDGVLGMGLCGCDSGHERAWFFGAAGMDGETDPEMDAGECCWECLPDALDGKWAGDVRRWYPGLRMVWAEWAGDSEKGAAFEVWAWAERPLDRQERQFDPSRLYSGRGAAEDPDVVFGVWGVVALAGREAGRMSAGHLYDRLGPSSLPAKLGPGSGKWKRLTQDHKGRWQAAFGWPGFVWAGGWHEERSGAVAAREEALAKA